MKSYIRIKKSKQLRFKLVSMLILLFICISIINIPIGWISENQNLNKMIEAYLREQSNSDSLLIDIKLIKKEFKETIQVIDVSSSSTNYIKTNDFFIYKKKGDEVFHFLRNLFNQYSEDSLFIYLFKDELENGLLEQNSLNWVEWKFKDTPEDVALLFINELSLKIWMLKQSKPKPKSISIKYSFVLHEIKLGDKMKYFLPSTQQNNLRIISNNKIYEEGIIKDDTLIFDPKIPGLYEFSVEEDTKVIEFLIRVLPKQMFHNNAQKIITLFQDKSNIIEIVDVPQNIKLSCDCDPNIRLTNKNRAFEFTPNTSGWCHFQILNNNGLLLAADSLYVLPQPTPYLIVDGIFDNKISKSKLEVNKGMILKAMNPDKKYFMYEIQEIHYTLIGKEVFEKHQKGSKIDLKYEDIQELIFIKIDSAKVISGNANHIVYNTLLIEVL